MNVLAPASEDMKTILFLLLCLCVAGLAVPAHAGLDIVSADASGNVNFTPSAIVVSVVEVVVACAVSAAAFVVLWHGVCWLFSELKRECPADPYDRYTAEDDARDRLAAGLPANPHWAESASIQTSMMCTRKQHGPPQPVVPLSSGGGNFLPPGPRVDWQTLPREQGIHYRNWKSAQASALADSWSFGAGEERLGPGF